MSVQYPIKTPIGILYLVASVRGLQGLYWNKQDVPTLKSLNVKVAEEKILAQAIGELNQYFAGKRKRFEVPLDLEGQGTAFQRSVWKQLMSIPFGRTVAYKDIACSIKNSKAVRAVGSANGKNPISIIVPCHRVIAADGTIGGYGGGLPAKRFLLNLEGCVHFS